MANSKCIQVPADAKPPTLQDLVYRIPPNKLKRLLIDSDTFPDKLFEDSMKLETKIITNEELRLTPENMDIIVWLSMRCIGWPDHAVANKGWVYNIKLKSWMFGSIRHDGSISLSMSHNDGKISCLLLHRLVAFMFHHNDDVKNKNTVDHRNHEPNTIKDNHMNNLLWATPLMQNQNRKLTGQSGIPVYQIEPESDKVIKLWDDCNAIAKNFEGYDIDISTLRKYCREGKIYKGFYWVYMQDWDNKLEDWKRVMHENKEFPIVFASAKGHACYGNKNNEPYGEIIIGSVEEAIDGKKSYRRVSVSSATKEFRMPFSHLIAAAFHGARPSPKHEINHDNGNTLDDRAANLAWVTGRENTKHAYDTGLVNNPGGNNQVVFALNERFIVVKDYHSKCEASRLLIVSRYKIDDACFNFPKLLKGYYLCSKENYVEGNKAAIIANIRKSSKYYVDETLLDQPNLELNVNNLVKDSDEDINIQNFIDVNKLVDFPLETKIDKNVVLSNFTSGKLNNPLNSNKLNSRSRPLVMMKIKDGPVIRPFDSLTEAYNHLHTFTKKCKRETISKACESGKEYKGFYWKFTEKSDNSINNAKNP